MQLEVSSSGLSCLTSMRSVMRLKEDMCAGTQVLTLSIAYARLSAPLTASKSNSQLHGPIHLTEARPISLCYQMCHMPTGA